MKKLDALAASAVALSAALATGGAQAHGTLAVTTANYNAASVTAAAGVITVPWGGVASAVYAVTTLSGGATTSLEVNSRFTVTLPAGFSFASSPSLSTGGGITSTALIAGGIGSQTATFQIGAPAVAGGNTPLGVGGTLALNQVSVQGATALETPGAALQITEQSTNNAEVLNNDPTPIFPSNGVPPPFTFTSDSGVLAAFTQTVLNFVDLTPPSLGTLFTVNPGAPPFTDTPTVDIGHITLTGSGSLAANGSTAIISTTDTATITIAGFFNGIKTTFSALHNTVTPASTGTATATSITIPAVATTFPGSDIFITATGTTFLQANNGNFTAAYAPSTGVTDFLGGTVTSTANSIAYTGGTSLGVTNFLTGSDAGYTSLVRLTNGSSTTQTVFAVAEPYTGGPQLVGSLGTIGAGIGTVFTEAQIGTATGLALANSGQRATLTLISIPGVGAGTLITASGLLVNPGGVVDNVN
jgi:hypothetical protein